MLFLDGKAFRPDGKSASVLIPPAFGLAGVNLHTWTGWGGVSHWNAFVANLEMHGKGTFFDPRLDDATPFSDRGARTIRARARGGRPDHAVAAGAADLPARIAGPGAAARQLRPLGCAGAARACSAARRTAAPATCRRSSPSLAGTCIRGEEIGIDDFQASRSPDGRYRTAPLRGLWTHGKGGFYHDGRFPTLAAVIDHYDSHFSLGLSCAGEERSGGIPEVALMGSTCRQV